MSDERRKHVIPGEVITSRPMRPEENVVFDGKNISSTIVGTSEIYDDAVRVLPLTGMYFPKVDDMVVGKVISHTSLSWEVDINSCYVGFLPASDIFFVQCFFLLLVCNFTSVYGRIKAFFIFIKTKYTI